MSREIVIKPGTLRDYRAMKRWHYRAGMVAAATRVMVAWHGKRRAGVIVEAMPVLSCRLRDVATERRFVRADRGEGARAVNSSVRAISRVVVHPTYRGIGLAVRMVRAMLETSTSEYVEAMAAMGKVNPFFERAGMERWERHGSIVYYLHHRHEPREPEA